MAYLVSGTDLTSVANAIRTAGETSAPLEFPSGFITAIGNISGGGGGGATNVVQGSFTGAIAEKGTAKSISVPYSGSGYPVAIFIFPSNGADAESIATLVHKYAVCMFMFTKNDVTSTPTYSGNTAENKGTVLNLYKYSDSDPATTTAGRDASALILYTGGAQQSTATCARMTSATNLSVYIADATSGFPDSIEFTYIIVYSS